MRDANRLKEKVQLTLDGRQVASVVVAALLILAAVFVLGMNVGKQLALRREEAPAPRPADPLAALDAPPPSADAGEPPKLSYHEALVKPVEPVRPAPVPAPPAAPRPAVPAEPPAAPAPSAPPTGELRGAFAIQVGAAQDLGEAQRILDRFPGHRGRIVAADIPGKGRWYRVRLGAFETRQEAERYLRDLERETGARGFVAPNN